MSPGAPSVAETDLTISGCTWSWLVTVLLFDGVGVSVEVALAVFGIVYGVAEMGSVVLVLTVNETVALTPGHERAHVPRHLPGRGAAGRSARAAREDGVRGHGVADDDVRRGAHPGVLDDHRVGDGVSRPEHPA